MKENTFRAKSFYWILENILRHDDYKFLRWWEILVRYFFMPLNTFWWYLNKHHEIVNDYGMIIRLFGVDYNIRFFAAMVKPGNVFEIVKDKNGTITIKKVKSD